MKGDKTCRFKASKGFLAIANTSVYSNVFQYSGVITACKQFALQDKEKPYNNTN